MKTFLLLIAGLLPITSLAVELPMKLDELEVKGGKVYEDVTILSADDIGVKIMHSAGTARIPFRSLPRTLAKKFEYDPAAALAQRQREAEQEAEAARRAAMIAKEQKLRKIETAARHGAQRPRSVPGKEPRPALVIPGSRDGLNEQELIRIQQLEAGIRNAESEIAEKQAEIRESNSRAAGTVRIYYDEYRSIPSRKADYLRRKAEKLDQEIRGLEHQIDQAKIQIDYLEQTAADRRRRKP